MSTILQLNAISLDKLNGFIGSKDAKLEKQLLSSFADSAADIDLSDKKIESGKERLKSLIATGAEQSAKKESAVDILIASALAEQASNGEEIDGELEWPWSEISELERQFEKRYDARTKELLAYFTNGRNLWGKGFADDDGWYLYLKNGEIKDLCKGLKKVHEQASEIVDSGAMNEQDFDGGLVDTLEQFLETLSSVEEAGADLFVVSC